jgi:hypothetical protein
MWIQPLPASRDEPGGVVMLVEIGLPITDAVTEERLTAVRDWLRMEIASQAPPLPSDLADAMRRFREQHGGLPHPLDEA